jgi:VWFA-related protein
MLARGHVAILALATLGAVASLWADPQKTQTPTFRAGITIVPLDVRVLDRDGRPVTDLEQHEFTVLEDGVARDITHFSRHILEAAEPRPALRARAGAGLFDLAPTDFRVFLIIVGGGSLGDFGAGQAIARFVRALLPQDQVAVVSGGRATDFTTDHEKIAQGIERLAGPASPKSVAGTQQKPITSQRDPVFRDRPTVEPSPAPAPDLGFAEYVNAPGRSGGDVQQIRSGIGYLRYLPGEKHIILLSQNGLSFTSMEGVKQLAVEASDARVALDVILTGGIPANPTPNARGMTDAWPVARSAGPPPLNPDFAQDRPTEAARVVEPRPLEHPLAALTIRPMAPDGPVPIPGYSLDDLIRHGDNRAVSRMTGGQAWTNEWPAKALNRVDTSSRSYYQLAYSPSNTVLDGRYRSIKVKVSRPGVTVLSRVGYIAREAPPVPDRRKYLTESRIAAAGDSTDDLNDIRVQMKASVVPAALPKAAEAIVELAIEVTRLSLAAVDGQYVGSLNVAVFCGDKRETVVGEIRQTLDLALSEDTYERAIRDGLRHTVRVPVRRPPRYVKAVVYDYGSDLLGSVLVKLPTERR